MEDDRRDDLAPPNPSLGDDAHALVKSVLGAIPFAGTAAVELFNRVVVPPLERRSTAWRESVGAKLQAAAEAGRLDLNALKDDEQFISIVLQASRIAAGTHRAEKLEALRNAVINTALGNGPDADSEAVFVRYVEELTPTHVAVLSAIEGDEQALRDEPSYEIIHHHLVSRSGVSVELSMFRLCMRDLDARDLLRLSTDLEDLPGLYETNKVVTADHKPGPRLMVTRFGKAFLRYIRSADSAPLDTPD